jgi:hypothetical protein
MSNTLAEAQSSRSDIRSGSEPVDEILCFASLRIMSEYDDILEFAIGMAVKASKMIKDGRAEMWKTSGIVTSKLSSVDVSPPSQPLCFRMVELAESRNVGAESSW